MHLNGQTLGDFSWAGALTSAASALKANAPALISAAAKNRIERINAKRAQRAQAASLPLPVDLQPQAAPTVAAPYQLQMPSAPGGMPPWLVPVAIGAGVLALVMLRK